MREDFVPFMAKPVEAQNMKNPSLGKIWSLCQINQVSKEENQRRNLTSNNFTTHLLALQNGQEECMLQDRERTKLKEFRKPFFLLQNFCTPFLPCETGECELRKACETTTEEKQFRNPIFALQNSPYVIFRYFPTNSVRFLFQDILCNYPFSSCNQLKIFLDIVISWRYFIFRCLGYFSEGLQISHYICLRISHFCNISRARNLLSLREIPERSLVHSY